MSAKDDMGFGDIQFTKNEMAYLGELVKRDLEYLKKPSLDESLSYRIGKVRFFRNLLQKFAASELPPIVEVGTKEFYDKSQKVLSEFGEDEIGFMTAILRNKDAQRKIYQENIRQKMMEKDGLFAKDFRDRLFALKQEVFLLSRSSEDN